MPLIPAKKGDWGDLVLRFMMLWFDPTRPHLDRRLLKDAEAHFDVHGARAFPDKIKPTPAGMARALAAPPEGMRLPVNLTNAVSRGVTAGVVLLSTLRLAANNEAHASLENGVRVAQLALKKNRFPSSRSTVLDAWKTHRATAHIWAAVIQEIATVKRFKSDMGVKLTAKEAAATTNVAPLGKTVAAWFSDLPRFVSGVKKARPGVLRVMAHAEEIRKYGESHSGPGQKARGQRLLQPGTAWKIPPSFALPHVKVHFKKLSPDERKVLKTGRK